ncbi:hypothetical protein B0J18DRAFT_176004 [Chaetomium sp. MPI-SDFR-AT-0129]|nr:hypothetical protein B0J18DRAFT_176004 [Chaetomium sp. MPI-SDFR-AT-0129]
MRVSKVLYHLGTVTCILFCVSFYPTPQPACHKLNINGTKFSEWPPKKWRRTPGNNRSVGALLLSSLFYLLALSLMTRSPNNGVRWGCIVLYPMKPGDCF